MDQFFSNPFLADFLSGVAENPNYMSEICQFEQFPENAFNGHKQKTRNCAEVVLLAMIDAQRAMYNTAGPEMKDWRFNKFIKSFHFAGPFDKIPIIGKYFMRKQDILGGSVNTIGANSYFLSKDGTPSVKNVEIMLRAQANYRQIVDLGDFKNSLYISDAGNNESFLSNNFFDQAVIYGRGDYLPMSRGEESAKANAVDVINFTPAGAKKDEL
jgi:penicillin amidase